ncbi:MAG TPA: hypothetical protein VGO73_00960 [Pyrinomonadaceae bacterium]|jgi:hypothetical protein|nr:hypothetical protein [Pyrinomonadaceae bacterium]
MPTESGDMKLLGNFRSLIDHVSAEPDYNPSNPGLTKSALESLYTAAQAAVAEVATKIAPHKVAINERQTGFEDLPRRVGNSFRMVKASGADKKIRDDLETSRRKLSSKRKSKAVKDDPNTPKDEAAATHSASQMSYDNQVGNLQSYVALLSNIASYQPNENELKVSSLQALTLDLKARNDAVIATFVPLGQARGKRDQLLYAADGSVVNTALGVKAYVSAAFGTNSQLNKQVKGIKFDRKRRV